MNMRKMTALLMAVILVLTMSACGDAQSEEKTAEAPAAEAPAAEAPAAEAPAAESDSKTITLADGTEWPTKPITILCGYSAGGNADLLCRFLAEPLSEELGVPVVVENVTGAGSWIAWNQMLNGNKDGYTMAHTNLNAVLGYYDTDNPREDTIDDFDLLANLTVDYNVLCIRNDETRFHDYPSLIEYAKENQLVMAADGQGLMSGDATIIEHLNKNFGCNIMAIPVDGYADALTMFMAGETDFIAGNISDLTDAEANGYHAIVVFSDQRSAFYPDIPTVIETGIDDYISYSCRGFGYADGVDPAIVEYMQEVMAACYENPDFQETVLASGSELRLAVGDEYYDIMVSMVDKYLDIWDIEK